MTFNNDENDVQNDDFAGDAQSDSDEATYKSKKLDDDILDASTQKEEVEEKEKFFELTNLSVTSISPTEKTATFTVVYSEINDTYRQIMAELKRIRIKGFRPGMVPDSILRKIFMRSIKKELIDNRIAPSLYNALTVADESPILPLNVDIVDFKENQDLHLTCRFECLPDLKVPPVESFHAYKYL
ncbi:MAG: trigger factor family protein, partial [Deltaproteobacteria bacterium]|nr:trigger factor family protein [Deltaproteobacteria bacterium]